MPGLDITDAVGRHAQQHNYHNLGLLGTRFTIHYGARLSQEASPFETQRPVNCPRRGTKVLYSSDYLSGTLSGRGT